MLPAPFYETRFIQMIEQLQQTVYILTNSFLWPVVIALLAGMAHTLYLLGNLCSEAFQRRGKAGRRRRSIRTGGRHEAAAGICGMEEPIHERSVRQPLAVVDDDGGGTKPPRRYGENLGAPGPGVGTRRDADPRWEAR